jgi:hypothetical protein
MISVELKEIGSHGTSGFRMESGKRRWGSGVSVDQTLRCHRRFGPILPMPPLRLSAVDAVAALICCALRQGQ